MEISKVKTHRHGALPPKTPVLTIDCDDNIVALDFAPEVGAIVACTAIGRLTVFDAADGAKRFELDPGCGAHVLACGPQIAVSGGLDGRVMSWNLVDGQKQREMQCASGVEALAYISKLAGGNMVASGDDTGAVSVWDLASGWMMHRLPCSGAVHALVWCGSGTSIVIFGGSAMRVSAWDYQSGIMKWESMCGSQVSALAASSSNRLVAVGESSGKIMVRDYDTGQTKWAIENSVTTSRYVEGHAITCLAFVEDEDILISAECNRLITWDLRAERKHRETRCAAAGKRFMYSETICSVIAGGPGEQLAVWSIQSLI